METKPFTLGPGVALCLLAFLMSPAESLKRLELIDFDALVPGRGPPGRKEHVRMFRGYMEDPRGAVLKSAREGKSLEEMKTLITLPEYAH